MKGTILRGRKQPLLFSLISLAVVGMLVMSARSASSSTTPTSTATKASDIMSRTAGCPTHLQDGANAQTMTFNNIRGVRYGEISLLCCPQGSSMYNTTGLNNQTDHTDTAPASLWNNVSE